MTMPGKEYMDQAPLGYGAYLCVKATGRGWTREG